MSHKRLLSCVLSVLLVGLGSGATAHAKKYSLTNNSGAQLHIGNGLALPIQAAATPLVTGMVLPPLLIPKKAGPVTVMQTTPGLKLTVPPGVLSKPAVQNTVGVFFSNPTVHAVGTNINFRWPNVLAVFDVSDGPRSAANDIVTMTSTRATGVVRYSPRVAGKRFGGPGQFALAPGGPGGLAAGAVTVYLKVGPFPAPPPCTHTALTPVPFPGPGVAGCGALLAPAYPTGLAVIGGMTVGKPLAGSLRTGSVMATPGGPPVAAPAIYIGKFGPGSLKPLGPAGTISFLAVAGGVNGVTNMALSTGFPWTTGKLTIMANSGASAETFVISGDDTRTAMGAGTIQMVSGAVSQRLASGPNSNRGWVRLQMMPLTDVPSMSMPGLAATVALILLGFGYATRRRIIA